MALPGQYRRLIDLASVASQLRFGKLVRHITYLG